MSKREIIMVPACVCPSLGVWTSRCARRGSARAPPLVVVVFEMFDFFEFFEV